MDFTIIQAALIVVVFLVFTILLMTRKLQTILGLPLLAIAIAVIAGVPFISSDPSAVTITKNVVMQGAMRLSVAMTGLVFGGVFGQTLTKVGITKEIIRRAAEMAGDKALSICFAFYAASIFIFSASGGLGMLILVGSIVIPILLTAGVSPFLASMLVLVANGVGEVFNIQWWGFYRDAMGIDVAVIAQYSPYIAIPMILFGAIMILYFYNKEGAKRKAWAMPSQDQVEETFGDTKPTNSKKVKAYALIAPVIPVLLVLLTKMEIAPAMMIGMIAALVLTWPKRPLHILAAAFIEGIQQVAGAFALMIGIGMVLVSVGTPQVSQVLQPMFLAITPTTQLAYILFFALLSPLAIYRGPLNIYGLGAGIAALFVSAGLSPIAVMLGLRACGNMQTACDPTNSYQVWASDYAKFDLNDYVKKTVPFMYVCVAIVVVICSFLVF